MGLADEFSKYFPVLARTPENYFINTATVLPEHPEDADFLSRRMNMREFSVLIAHWFRTLKSKEANKEIGLYAVKKLLHYIYRQADIFDDKETPILLDDISAMSSTDGKVIRLSTSMFKEVETKEQLHIGAHTFVAHYFHELCHVLYTDFSVLGSYRFTQASSSANSPATFKNILNLVEDERIENKFIAEHSADRNDLGVYNYWIKRYCMGGTFSPEETTETLKMIEVKGGKSFSNHVRWQLLFTLVRYPDPSLLECFFESTSPEIKEVSTKFYDGFVAAVKRVSKEGTHSLSSTHRALDLTVELDLLFDQMHDNEIPNDFKEKMLRMGTFGGANEERSKELKKIMRKVAALTDKEAEEVQQQVMEDLKAPVPNPDLVELVSETNTKFLRGCPREPQAEAYLRERPHVAHYHAFILDKPATLEDIQREVGKSYAPLRKLLVTKSLEHAEAFKGFKHGRLDTSKLVNGVLGDENIYYNKAVTAVNRLSLVVIVDQSFSMQQEKKISKARKAVYMLAKAFDGLAAVELFIYGYSSDLDGERNNEVYIYTEPGKKIEYSFINSISAQSENRDGVVYNEILKRASRLTKNPILCFIISDGNPVAHDYSGGVQHTKEVVQGWEKKGVFICQVAIDSVASASMYTNYVNFKESKNMAGDVVNFIRSKVLKKLKPKVTYEC